MEQKQIVAGNLLLNYYFAPGKNPGGSAIIFLHGWRSRGDVWAQAVKDLRGSCATAYAIDLPGFGSSERPKRSYALEDYAETLKAFMEKLGIGKAALVGHSFGGRIAIKFAASHPPLVSKIVLVDSGGIRAPSASRNAKRFFAKLLKPLFAPSFMRGARNAAYGMIGAEDYVATPELKETFVRVVEEDLAPLLSRIRVPACIVWGADDATTPLADGRVMETHIPGARLAVLPRAGHFSFLDRPDDFARLVSKFITEPSDAL